MELSRGDDGDEQSFFNCRFRWTVSEKSVLSFRTMATWARTALNELDPLIVSVEHVFFGRLASASLNSFGGALTRIRIPDISICF